jgi:Family of unknown function (DUF6338)
MDSFLKPETYQFVWSVLPGFVAAWVFHGLTPHRKANQFERIVQALIFTAFIFPTASFVRWAAIAIGSQMTHPWGAWSESVSWPLVSLPVGILWGTVFAAIANTNVIHNALPDWVTKRTSYPSEWYSALREKRYVYLQLTGKRRIYGWPNEFPDHPDTGHFILEEAEWIIPGDPPQRAPLAATKRILIPAKEVLFVEQEKRWDQTRWPKEMIEPYSESDLQTSVRLLGGLVDSEDQEEEANEPETTAGSGTEAESANE